MSSILRLESISLKFGGLTALSDVSLEIARPGIHGIIGPNGAGKSTLFNLITGIYKPTSGKIFFKERELSRLDSIQITRHGVARTFQNIRLLPHLSILDNLKIATASEREGTFWASFLGLPAGKEISEELEDRAEKLLKLVGLDHLKDSFPTSLPYGNQRKLEIARALMRQPQLLLLDEPAAGMNRVEKDELADILKSILTQEITLVIIEHDMKFVMSLCERISVLSQGSICAEGTPAEVQQNPHVIETYLGKRSSC